MFGRQQEFNDPDLGTLERKRGAWRGQVRVEPFGALRLTVPGPRSAPDADALALARSATDQFDRCRPTIELELAEHRVAYDDGRPDTGTITPSYVAVISLDRRLVLEFGYRVPWDEEHTLGARLSDGRLIELSGSVIEP